MSQVTVSPSFRHQPKLSLMGYSQSVLTTPLG